MAKSRENDGDRAYRLGVQAALQGTRKCPFPKTNRFYKVWWKGWFDTQGSGKTEKSDEIEWCEKHAGYVPHRLRGEPLG